MGIGKAIKNAKIGKQVGREMAHGGLRGAVTRGVVKKAAKKPGNTAFKVGARAGIAKGPVSNAERKAAKAKRKKK